MIDTVLAFFASHPWAAVATAALIGLIGTTAAILSQRGVNRRRATVDMLTQKMWDKDYIETQEHFFQAMANQEQIMVDYDL